MYVLLCSSRLIAIILFENPCSLYEDLSNIIIDHKWLVSLRNITI